MIATCAPPDGSDCERGERGQLLTGSYMDYAMPRAEDAPLSASASHPVPATTNPLGAKGCGEAGCAGALPSVMNALVDALSEYNIRHLDMPATPNGYGARPKPPTRADQRLTGVRRDQVHSHLALCARRNCQRIRSSICTTTGGLTAD